MDRVALCGSMYSGKSSLSRSLEARGYLYVNYTRTLKELLVQALRAIGLNVTVLHIESNKSDYRTLLQSFSEVIGFNTGKYVERSLNTWLVDQSRPVVFDNVRTPEQFAVLRLYGFQLVHMSLPVSQVIHRAGKLGVNIENLIDTLNHPIENAIPASLIDLKLDARRHTEELVEEVIAYAPLSKVQRRTPTV